MMEREEIISELRRAAAENSGRPPGRHRFEDLSGIGPYAWGAYWARYGDLLAEAGFTPNQLNEPFPMEHLLLKYIEAIREFGRVPTATELRMIRSRDGAFPSKNSFERLGGRAERLSKVVEYCGDDPGYADVVAVCRAAMRTTGTGGNTAGSDEGKGSVGSVYLLGGRRGEFKIGHTSGPIERRMSALAIGSAVDLELVHEIRTDDPVGVEAYWHRRFADRAIRGEWFRLSAADVRAFKRWRRIY